MNNTLINSINNLDNMVSQKPADNIAMDKSGLEFDKVLDKTSKTLGDVKEQNSDKTSKTLGDVKEKFSIIDSDELADLKEILKEATGEANVETSLDLTLARDISEVVAQLKNALPQKNGEEQADEDESADDLVLENADTIMFAQVSSLQTGNAELTTPSEIASIKNLYKPIDLKVVETSEDEMGLEVEEDVLKELNIESVKVHTDTDDASGDLLNSQTPQEQAVKALMNHDTSSFESKINQVQSASNGGSAQTANQVQANVNPSKIIEQVSKQLENMQNTSKVSIVLNPESLGKVTVELVKSPEGLSAQFTTATQEARELLMKGLDGLKDALSTHGVGVDNVSVKLNEAQKGEYNSDWTDKEGSRGGNKEQGRSNKDDKDKDSFERMMAQNNGEQAEV